MVRSYQCYPYGAEQEGFSVSGNIPVVSHLVSDESCSRVNSSLMLL